MSKQDRVSPRTATDIQRMYNFGETFAEMLGLATDAQNAADRAQEAADKASEAVGDLDQNLTSEEIFNRLTNNSTDQGIYRENGKIYINANFIQAGSISSDMIKAGVIRSTDYEVVEIDPIYPSSSVFPDVLLFPNNGEDISRGIEIDFAAGVIRGVLVSDVTDVLEKRIEALEMAVPELSEVLLYENSTGSSETISLKRNGVASAASNYRYLEIYFTDNNGMAGGYTKVWNPSGKTVQLALTESGNYIYQRQTLYTISGSEITPDIDRASLVTMTSGGGIESLIKGTNYLKIVRVVGHV